MDIMMIVLLVVLCLLMFIPQHKHAKARQKMLDEVKSGDKIITVDRIFAEVKSVDGDKLVINIGSEKEVLIEIHKEGIGEVLKDKSLASEK